MRVAAFVLLVAVGCASPFDDVGDPSGRYRCLIGDELENVDLWASDNGERMSFVIDTVSLSLDLIGEDDGALVYEGAVGRLVASDSERILVERVIRAYDAGEQWTGADVRLDTNGERLIATFTIFNDSGLSYVVEVTGSR